MADETLRVTAITNIYPSLAQPSQGTFVEQQVKGLEQAGLAVRVVYIDRARDGMRVYRDVPARLAEAVKDFCPDIVHVMYGGILAEVATRAGCGKPVVVSFCGSDLYGERGNNPLRRIFGRCGVWASYRAAGRAAAVIVKSKSMRNLLPAALRGKVSVLPNGLDLDRFQPMDQAASARHLGWSPDRFHVLFAGSFQNPVKRPRLAAKAVQLLCQSGISAELHEMRDVPHHQAPVWLNAAGALLLTSAHEGSPNIVKEALACNRPVVSVDAGDVAERISNIDGCYISPAVPARLCEALAKVAASDNPVNGRASVQELSLARVSENLIAIYESLRQRSPRNADRNSPSPHSGIDRSSGAQCIVGRAMP